MNSKPCSDAPRPQAMHISVTGWLRAICSALHGACLLARLASTLQRTVPDRVYRPLVALLEMRLSLRRRYKSSPCCFRGLFVSSLSLFYKHTLHGISRSLSARLISREPPVQRTTNIKMQIQRSLWALSALALSAYAQDSDSCDPQNVSVGQKAGWRKRWLGKLDPATTRPTPFA